MEQNIPILSVGEIIFSEAITWGSRGSPAWQEGLIVWWSVLAEFRSWQHPTLTIISDLPLWHHQVWGATPNILPRHSTTFNQVYNPRHLTHTLLCDVLIFQGKHKVFIICLIDPMQLQKNLPGLSGCSLWELYCLSTLVCLCIPMTRYYNLNVWKSPGSQCEPLIKGTKGTDGCISSLLSTTWPQIWSGWNFPGFLLRPLLIYLPKETCLSILFTCSSCSFLEVSEKQ